MKSTLKGAPIIPFLSMNWLAGLRDFIRLDCDAHTYSGVKAENMEDVAVKEEENLYGLTFEDL